MVAWISTTSTQALHNFYINSSHLFSQYYIYLDANMSGMCLASRFRGMRMKLSTNESISLGLLSGVTDTVGKVGDTAGETVKGATVCL
jgi:hypothetical protein